jgi:formate-dependent nitrite reductase cytochrome c552 subunit
MGKLIRHKWIKRDGFRTHQCEKCKVYRYWDSDYQRLMFKWGRNIAFTSPTCIGMNEATSY